MTLTGLSSLRAIQLRGSLATPQRCARIPCAWSVGQRRWNTTESRTPTPKGADENDKPYYISTPIFYVNAAPHIGHLYTMVLADVLKRWQQLKGNTAFLSTGTDEHGMKIQRAALRDGVEPKDMCDDNSAQFRELAEKGSISYDEFIRTTDERHKEAVGHFYTTMKTTLTNKMGLYKDKHAGWYSVSDECFYPEDLVEPSMVPQTGKKVMVSKETGSAVEWIEEETWFFPLTKYKDQLLKFYKENPGWIQPAFRMDEVRDWVENHLEDLSVTRPAARLSWGIKDPEDAKQTIYVWVDALINYLTLSGYGKDWHYEPPAGNLWPADLHVVGKDIIRFHAVYWPAMLIALNLPLPKGILCHNHWTMSNRKMSKSVGNVVSPIFAMQRWGVDPLRYFLMRNGSLKNDMDYSNEIIQAIYEKELGANIGNLFYRTFRPKRTSWVTADIMKTYRGSFKNYADLNDPTDSKRHLTSLEPFIDSCPRDVARAMKQLNPSKALNYIFILLRETNRYISDIEPWKNPNRAAVDWCIYNCMEALRIAAILLQPIMPTKAAIILDGMNVRPDRRTLRWAARGADLEYGLGAGEGSSFKTKLSRFETLFPPSTTSDPKSTMLNSLLPYVNADASRSPRKAEGKTRTNKLAAYLAMEAKLGRDEAREVLRRRKEVLQGTGRAEVARKVRAAREWEASEKATLYNKTKDKL